MLRKAFTGVRDNPAFCDVRARAILGGGVHTHRGMYTHMYTSQTVSNDRNWEIMSTYSTYIYWIVNSIFY